MKRYTACQGLPFSEGNYAPLLFPDIKPTSVLTRKILQVISEGDAESTVTFSPSIRDEQIVSVRSHRGTIAEIRVLVYPGIHPWVGSLKMPDAINLICE